MNNQTDDGILPLDRKPWVPRRSGWWRLLVAMWLVIAGLLVAALMSICNAQQNERMSTNLCFVTNSVNWFWTNTIDGSLKDEDGHYIVKPRSIGTNKVVSENWSMSWSNGIDHPFAVTEFKDGRVVQSLEVMDSNTLPRLIREGEVCKLVGHCWRPGRPGETEAMHFADYHPGTTFRTCQICGRCESKTEGDWK